MENMGGKHKTIRKLQQEFGSLLLVPSVLGMNITILQYYKVIKPKYATRQKNKIISTQGINVTLVLRLMILINEVTWQPEEKKLILIVKHLL